METFYCSSCDIFSSSHRSGRTCGAHRFTMTRTPPSLGTPTVGAGFSLKIREPAVCVTGTECACSVASVVSDSLQSYRVEPARLLCPWDSPGKNTGGGLPCRPPGDLSNPGPEPTSPASQPYSLPLSLWGSLTIVKQCLRSLHSPSTCCLTISFTLLN